MNIEKKHPVNLCALWLLLGVAVLPLQGATEQEGPELLKNGSAETADGDQVADWKNPNGGASSSAECAAEGKRSIKLVSQGRGRNPLVQQRVKLAMDGQRQRRYDPYNLQTSIKGLIREGRNFLVMEQTLPPDWPLEKGMPYDGVRLFGDFHVEMPSGRTTRALLTPRPAAYEIGSPTLMQQLGHPHYGGIAIYSRQVQIAAGVECLALRFDKLHESAEIRVNGMSAGVLWQEPHLLEMEPSLWRLGENTLEIRCSTSPANYLQAMMRPSGFCGRVTLCC